jgi:hypothetical protein
LNVKTMNGAANSGRMMAVGHQPCSWRMIAASVWRCAISDFLLGEVDREVVRLRGGLQPGLVGVDQPLDDRAAEEREERAHMVASFATALASLEPTAARRTVAITPIWGLRASRAVNTSA